MATPTSNLLPTSITPSSGVWYIDPLLGGTQWGNTGVGTGITLSYSVPQDGAAWSRAYSIYLSNEPRQFSALNQDQAEMFRQALQAWADVANIQFAEILETLSEVGEIRVGFSSMLSTGDAAAWAYLPGDYAAAGDVWLDPNYAPNVTPTAGSYGYLTLLHEIGHALGLTHPFESNPPLSAKYDSLQFTIMSYTDSPLYATMDYPLTPMLYDIAAIQYLYGPNLGFHTGDDSYTFSNSASTVMALWDAGGTDTLSAANQSLAAMLDLRAGHYSSIGPNNFGGPAKQNVAIAFGAIFENAVGGSGNDTLIGNNGNNLLDGGPGADLLKGSRGNDTYVIDDAADIINDPLEGGGLDTVESSISYALTRPLENLVLLGSADLTGNGNHGNNFLTGNGGNNLLNGYAGNDTLGGGIGNDTLNGASGEDFFLFDSLPGPANVDTVNGFSHRYDTILLDHLVFDNLAGAGPLTRAEYYIGDSAHDASDRIIYDNNSGALYYDPDGNGAEAALQFAMLGAGLTVALNDFVVV